MKQVASEILHFEGAVSLAFYVTDKASHSSCHVAASIGEKYCESTYSEKLTNSLEKSSCAFFEFAVSC